MNNYKKIGSLFFLLLFSSQMAYGYIDPGTGSYLLQIVVAGFFAGAYTVKVYWRSITSFFKRK